MNEEERKIISLIQSMPVNYLRVSVDSLKNREYETVINIISLIREKFNRNPDLHISVDMDALDRVEHILKQLVWKALKTCQKI